MDAEARVAAVTGGRTRKQLKKALEKTESRLTKLKTDFDTYKEQFHMSGDNKMWAIIICALAIAVICIAVVIGGYLWQGKIITANTSNTETRLLSSCLEKCTLPGDGCPRKCSTTWLARCIQYCGKDKKCVGKCFPAPVAKLVRRSAANRVIPGSNPGGGSAYPFPFPYPIIIDSPASKTNGKRSGNRAPSSKNHGAGGRPRKPAEKLPRPAKK